MSSAYNDVLRGIDTWIEREDSDEKYYGDEDLIGLNCAARDCGTFIKERDDAVKVDGQWFCTECYESMEHLPSDDYWSRSVGTDEWIDKGWTPEGEESDGFD